MTVATNRDPGDFVRKDGQPSLIEQAAADFAGGMEGGDKPAMLVA